MTNNWQTKKLGDVADLVNSKNSQVLTHLGMEDIDVNNAE